MKLLKKTITKQNSQFEQVEEKFILDQISREVFDKYTVHYKKKLNELTKELENCSITKDHLISSYRWITHIQILKDSKDKITGIEVNTGNVMHL